MKLPRILITAASSGSGKTMITCGLLRALKRRGLEVSAFKCGPDYIDPMFHKNVLGIPSKNLDSFLADKDTLKYLFEESAVKADISVIEGVMGYYDGAGFDTTRASTFEVGQIISAPAVLVVNAKGMSLSTVAMIKGFLDYESDSGIKAVILNRVTKMTFMQLKPVIENKLGVKVIGFIPYSEECRLESRHLGLITPAELADLQKCIDKMADLAEENIDIDELIKIAEAAPELTPPENVSEISNVNMELTPPENMSGMRNEFSKVTPPQNVGEMRNEAAKRPVKIAVAYDKAFCFYYEDNLNLLRKYGAELEFFSPLSDSELPKGCSGLLLGGGYPEVYAEQLSKNMKIKENIRHAIENKMPCIAECGGFLYLHREIEDLEHKLHKMVGIIDAKAI